MAEVTKKKLASIYSLIVSFFLTAFSGHAHAGEIFFKRSQLDSAKRTETTATTLDAPSISTPRSMTMAPAPDAGKIDIVPTTSMTMAPAPDAGKIDIVPATSMTMVPAPDANQATATELVNIDNVQDVSLKSFISQRAMDQGDNPHQLSVQKFNTFRIEYLEMQVKSLEQQLQNINDQNLSH
jgi:hypothetical protein